MNWINFFKPTTIKIKISNKVLRIKDCRWFSSLYGLMFDKMKNIDGALIYANSVWMPFVKKKLDLFFLDKNFKIIDVQKAVPLTLNPKTWKVYRNENAKYCLEIKPGLIRRKITFKYLTRTRDSHGKKVFNRHFFRRRIGCNNIWCSFR